MKHIRLFENYDTEYDYLNYLDSQDFSTDSIETPEQLEKKLNTLTNSFEINGDFHFENFKNATKYMFNLKIEHPEFKEDEPWKNIWWKYIKIWYENLKKLSPEQKEIIQGIIEPKKD